MKPKPPQKNSHYTSTGPAVPIAPSAVYGRRRPKRLAEVPDWFAPESPESVARSQALRANTTPQGRELFRKILHRVQQSLVAKTEAAASIVARAEDELNLFACCSEEFNFLFFYWRKKDLNAAIRLSPKSIATLMVLLTSKDLTLARKAGS